MPLGQVKSGLLTRSSYLLQTSTNSLTYASIPHWLNCYNKMQLSCTSDANFHSCTLTLSAFCITPTNPLRSLCVLGAAKRLCSFYSGTFCHTSATCITCTYTGAHKHTHTLSLSLSLSLCLTHTHTPSDTYTNTQQIHTGARQA